MADNLNMTNDPKSQMNTDGSAINNAPSQSPLEQAGPAVPPATPPPPPPSPAPAEPSASPFPPEAPAPGAPQEPPPPAGGATPQIPTPPPPVAPATGEVDMGQSSTPPDTDEFLKSILQEQPQQQAPATEAPADMMTNQMPGESSQVNPPLQEQTPVANENLPLQSPGLNEAPIGQNPPAESASIPAPTAETVEANQPAMPGAMPQESKLNDTVSLGGLPTSGQPGTPPTPTPVNPDTPASSDVFGGAPAPQGGSGLKKVIIGVLALVVLAGGYYAYTVFGKSSGTANKSATNSSATKSVVASQSQISTASTGDVQRKSDLKVIQTALIDYKASSGKYPESATYTFLNTSGNVVEKALVPVYLSVLPQDPTPSKAYAYKSDGITFTLTAELDDASDPEVVLDNGKPLYRIDENSTASTIPATSTSTVSANTFPGSNVDTVQVGVSATATSAIDSSPPVPSAP